MSDPLVLIGQYDSPFVRRVGIALRLYGLAFRHRPLSVFADGEAVRALNPLMRVPVLVLADGTALSDSHMMLDYLDSLVPQAQRLFPAAEPARHRVLRGAALATGLAEKAVSLFYERQLHDIRSPVWEARCALQVGSVLAALEAEIAARAGQFWFGQMTHADIALACAVRFVTEAHPGMLRDEAHGAVLNHAARMEELPVFSEIYQAFVPPA